MNVFARAIPARPLRKLVMESEYIIVGNVIKTDTLIGERGFYIYMAKIAIIEALQGNINKDTLEIEFHPNLFCPEGDRYIEKTHVLSFFDKNKESDKFYTHALSYGVNRQTFPK